jgi:hypothetical protein
MLRATRDVNRRRGATDELTWADPNSRGTGIFGESYLPNRLYRGFARMNV